MTRVVMDPPIYRGQYVQQEECCFCMCDTWSVPARPLHIATDLDAPYIPPLRNWDEFAHAVSQYDEAWMVFTPPQQRYLQVPPEVRDRITAVCNPPTCQDWLQDWGFRNVVPTTDFNLDVAERLWPFFNDQKSVIQVNSGCPYRCHYCVWNREVFPDRRWADPKLVAHLSARSNYSYLLCSQITGDHGWIETFLTERRNSVTPFWTDLNCAHLPAFESDIRRLAKAGMRQAMVGTEAFCEPSLNRLACPHTVAQSRLMFDLLTDLGVRGTFQLRRGFGEEAEEIVETTDMLLQLAKERPEHLSLQTLRSGPYYYWHHSVLSDSIRTKWVSPLGYEVEVEDMDDERLSLWNQSYDKLREAGWRVR